MSDLLTQIRDRERQQRDKRDAEDRRNIANLQRRGEEMTREIKRQHERDLEAGTRG